MELFKTMPSFYVFVLILCFFLPFILLGVIFLFQNVFGKLAKHPKFFLSFGILSSILNFVAIFLNEGIISKSLSALLSLYWLFWGVYLYKIKKNEKS